MKKRLPVTVLMLCLMLLPGAATAEQTRPVYACGFPTGSNPVLSAPCVPVASDVPVIDLIRPNGLENISTESVFYVTWGIIGQKNEYGLSFALSVDGGASWEIVEELISNTAATSLAWYVTERPTSYNCLLRMKAWDLSDTSLRSVDQSDENFTLWHRDLPGQRPKLLNTYPMNDDDDVPIGSDIWMNFDGPMATYTFTFECIPDPGGWEVKTENSDTTITLSHNAFDPHRVYLFIIYDACDIYGRPFVDDASKSIVEFTTGAVPPPDHTREIVLTLLALPFIAAIVVILLKIRKNRTMANEVGPETTLSAGPPRPTEDPVDMSRPRPVLNDGPGRSLLDAVRRNPGQDAVFIARQMQMDVSDIEGGLRVLEGTGYIFSVRGKDGAVKVYYARTE